MSFNTALSGLKATSSELDVISNNIANVSTTGFKKSRTEFSDIYASSQFGSGGSAVGSGVELAAVSQQFSQGQIEFTDNNLDLAISGSGFFLLSNNGSISYSRAGAFGVDKNGFIVDVNNKRLQGFLADQSGNITGAMGDLQLNAANLPPLPTSDVKISSNLDATAFPPTSPFIPGFTPTTPPDPMTYTNATSTTIYDSLGNSHIITNYFIKAHEPNTWRVYVAVDGTDVTPTAATPPVGTPPVPYNPAQIPAPFTIVFDSSGNYLANNPASPPVYYGPGPYQNSQAPLANSGTLSTLNINDLTINNVAINATAVGSDSVSTTDKAASAIAMVAAINAKSQTHGVTATVNPNVLSLGVPTYGDLAAGDFAINGIPIVGISGNAGQLLGLINGQTSITGVVAAQPGGAGTAIELTANDGRNIQIATSGNTASGATFVGFNLNGGVALDEAQRSTLALSTPNNQAIIIGGNNPSSAGLTSGPKAGIVQTNSDIINVGNWSPSTGAAGPQPITIDVSLSTQYGAPFSVFMLSQNGYSTGRLSGADIDSSGVVLTKYDNGQSLSLGQVALANFGNVQGLKPVGNTDWVETFSSGRALIGAPTTSNFGTIQSGALEDSNTELTNELVALILAQRNFQANAQSIKTEDAITQTIINMR